MIAIVDYGLGNLYSIQRSLSYLGIDNEITRDARRIQSADHVILPGVGAFRDAIEKLNASGLSRIVIDQARAGVPLLGICLGMQLLFERSFEYGEYGGLSLIEGDICPLEADLKQPLKVPQIGWNPLIFKRESPLLEYTRPGDAVYYVHSYYAKTAGDAVVAVSSYGVDVPGIVQKGNVFGCQFHPEKSGSVGLNILKAFSELDRQSGGGMPK